MRDSSFSTQKNISNRRQVEKNILSHNKKQKRIYYHNSYIVIKIGFMYTYLEPNFEVEGNAGVTGRMEETECDTAIDTAAKQDSNFKALMGHRTGQVRPNVSIEAV